MWHIDIAHWSMYEIKRWHVAQKSADIEALNDLMSDAIILWPYDYDPTDALDYDMLTMDEWHLATVQLDAAIENGLSLGEAYTRWMD